MLSKFIGEIAGIDGLQISVFFHLILIGSDDRRSLVGPGIDRKLRLSVTPVRCDNMCSGE